MPHITFLCQNLFLNSGFISLGKIFKTIPEDSQITASRNMNIQWPLDTTTNYHVPKPLVKGSFKNFPEAFLCPYSQLLLDPSCLERQYRMLSPVSRPLANGPRSHSPLQSSQNSRYISTITEIAFVATVVASVSSPHWPRKWEVKF